MKFNLKLLISQALKKKNTWKDQNFNLYKQCFYHLTSDEIKVAIEAKNTWPCLYLEFFDKQGCK